MSFIYRRVPQEQLRAHALLSGLKGFAQDDNLINVLYQIRQSIRSLNAKLDADCKDADDWYRSELAAEAGLYAEAMVGTAFVVAQTYQTGVISAATRFHEWFPLSGCPGKVNEPKGSRAYADWTKSVRSYLLEVRKDRTDTAPYSTAQAINAFANFFKHSEEWDYRWSDAPLNNMNFTQCVVYHFGARSGHGLNLITGLQSLGYGVDQLDKVHSDLELWAGVIIAKCEAALPTSHATSAPTS